MLHLFTLSSSLTFEREVDIDKMANVNDDVREVESKECVNLLYLASTQGEICDPVTLLEQAEAKGIPISTDINVGGDKPSHNTTEPGYSHQSSLRDIKDKVEESTNANQSSGSVSNTQVDSSNKRCTESDVLMNRKDRASCEKKNATKRVCPRVNCPEKIVRVVSCRMLSLTLLSLICECVIFVCDSISCAYSCQSAY